jgi:hypothetical protein
MRPNLFIPIVSKSALFKLISKERPLNDRLPKKNKIRNFFDFNRTTRAIRGLSQTNLKP